MYTGFIRIKTIDNNAGRSQLKRCYKSIKIKSDFTFCLPVQQCHNGLANWKKKPKHFVDMIQFSVSFTRRFNTW